MLTVEWVKCQTGTWCPFETVDLSGVTASGVYVIWHAAHAGGPAQAVRVGQGDIAARISAHRNDPDCTMYRQRGLYVTWASLQPWLWNGVENYLADYYQPLVGERFPDVPPIAVNVPA